jgi:hypothetical protein
VQHNQSAAGLLKKLGSYGKTDDGATDSGTGSQPAQHFIKFSARATCQVVPGRSYRILDIKPGTFEWPTRPDTSRHVL